MVEQGESITTCTIESSQVSIEAVENEIDKHPYYSALYEAESNRNPKARPIDPKTGKLLSSAKGGFQFLNATAQSLDLKDPDNLGQAYKAVQRLTKAHAKRFGSDPAMLYSAHYLGATVLAKHINRQPLSSQQQAHVDYLKKRALPRFMRIYQRITKARGDSSK